MLRKANLQMLMDPKKGLWSFEGYRVVLFTKKLNKRPRVFEEFHLDRRTWDKV